MVDHWVRPVVVNPEINKRFAVTGWIATVEDMNLKHLEALKMQKGKY